MFSFFDRQGVKNTGQLTSRPRLEKLEEEPRKISSTSANRIKLAYAGTRRQRLQLLVRFGAPMPENEIDR